MTELSSCKSDTASSPDLPAQFRLLDTPTPLAGLNDTYWIARAVWVDGQRTDEGFLIYADKKHYLFLDKEEARAAVHVLSNTQWEGKAIPAGGASQETATPARNLSNKPPPHSLKLIFINLPLYLLSLPKQFHLGLSLGMLFFSLSLTMLLFPVTPSGFLLVLPIALASWLFGWRGSFLSVGTITLILFGDYTLTLGGALWTSAMLVPFIAGTLTGCCIGLIVAALRHMTDLLLETQHHATRTYLAYQHEQLLSQLKEQALMSLSHELRTPLTQIQGYLELLELCQGQLDSDTLASYFSGAQGGCTEMLSLINTVLEAASTSIACQSAPGTFSLKHEIQTVIAHFDPRLLAEHNLRLAIPDVYQVRGDQRFVRQIMRNLLANAFKYTPPSTSITISATPVWERGKEARICVRVQDQGPGITPDQQALLFQRFVRLPNEYTKKTPGTGLGLFLCKQLTEAMGGKIWVESTGQSGKGCCFAFTLARVSPLDTCQLGSEDAFAAD